MVLSEAHSFIIMGVEKGVSNVSLSSKLRSEPAKCDLWTGKSLTKNLTCNILELFIIVYVVSNFSNSIFFVFTEVSVLVYAAGSISSNQSQYRQCGKWSLPYHSVVQLRLRTVAILLFLSFIVVFRS